MVWHRCLKRTQIRLLFVLFIIVFVVGVLLYVPVFEKYVYININKGDYLEKKYFLKINISSTYKKNFKNLSLNNSKFSINYNRCGKV